MTILSNKKPTSSVASNDASSNNAGLVSQIEQPDQLANVELTIPADALISEQTGRDSQLNATDDPNTVNIQISNMQNVSEHF